VKPLALTKLADVQVQLLPDAITQRDTALDVAGKLTGVSDTDSQSACVEVLRTLKGITKAVEDSRKDIKAPVLDLGRKIDSFASEFVAKVDIEIARLTKLLSTYQAEQHRIAAEAERKRQEELRRQEAERQRKEAEERKAREDAERAAEEARQKAEAEFLAPTEAEAAKARQEAEEAERKAREEAEKAEQARRDKAAAEQASLELKTSAPVVAVKAAGMSVGTVWKFEVTDLNQLVKSRPELCRIEANTAAINAELRAGKRDIPGLRIWSETVANVR
jgi:outer membrane receptor for ferrienterochelin and colicin